MHNFVYLAQPRSQEFSCEPNFGRAPPPWLRQWAYTRICSHDLAVSGAFQQHTQMRHSRTTAAAL